MMVVKQVVIHLFLLGCFLHDFAECNVKVSEFRLDGDYLIGGLFDIHHVVETPYRNRPEATTCSSQTLILSSYMRFNVMRFSIEEINNSTVLLPNVTLGYEIFDHCSVTQNFPNLFNLISVNGLIQPKNISSRSFNVIAVVGTLTSTDTLTAAPIFMMELVPMISYGASSSVLSEKRNYPSFLRTVHPNKDVIEVVVKILLHFNWRWVSFLYTDDDYGKDALALFIDKIKDTEICLAYTKGLTVDTEYPQIIRHIDSQRVNVIIAFALEWTAEDLIKAAIKRNVTNKVWIAGDTWSLHKQLPKEKGIKNIGTILGVAEPLMTIPGFSDFIHSFKANSQNGNANPHFCNQNCNCSDVSAEDIINADPSSNFPVYSAVYAVAHALHTVLQCGAGSCNRSIKPQPHMVLAALKKSKFVLLNRSVMFDENGDPEFGPYSIVFWNHSGEAEVVGFSDLYPSVQFYINDTKIHWHSDKVPVSLCSQTCPGGYAMNQEGIHHCCFSCTICPNGTYVNSTGNPHDCINCKENEWSEEGSTSCNQRLVEFIPFTNIGAMLIMVCTLLFLGLGIAVSVLFAINYNTPVVKSAGGPMCFLILVCLSLCSVGVFFYFDKPTTASCVLRFLPFLLFFTVCLACFVVRSFQIICIFKIAAKFPKLLSWWVKYNGQWFIISVAFVTQGILLIIGYAVAPPKPLKNIFFQHDRIILDCDFNQNALFGSMVFLSSLCILCFIFSYMGKDLPKNYNEAKAITFCLLLLILTWVVFATTWILYRGKYIPLFNALAVLSSLYSLLLWYFLPKCYIIIFQPNKNTQQHFQGLIQNYTKTVSQ
ncbi:taste receptor type 1 member 1-like [Nothobranchius furzeri]|uniref:Taste receptor type 1 member 1-like n=1 Tax=Nothobranchius furzeri TaxID=105023 RepID=A0A8C6Q2Y9_NOTFU|nr:taste receptor type 1 member 1-like [Nothobranchius furzeri]